MAAKVLLPGFGGSYTSETFSGVSLNSVGADTIDCSYCASLAVSIITTGSITGLSLRIEQSFDNVGWTLLGSAITAASVTLYSITAGPFGLIRFKNSITTGTVALRLTGFPLQTSW